MEAILASEQDQLPGSPIFLRASPAEGISCADHHHGQTLLALHTLQLTALETWEEERTRTQITTPSQQASERRCPVSHPSLVWERGHVEGCSHTS